MAGKLAEGAALGASFGSASKELFELVKKAVKNVLDFEPRLQSLQLKLDTLNKWVDDIKDLNKVVGGEVDATKDFIKLMEKGKVLVGKCLEIGKLNPQRTIYGGQLSEFEESIQKSIDFFLPLFRARIELEKGNDMKNIHTTVEKIYRNSGGRNWKLSCAVPPPPKFTVGLDVHTVELKRQLLNKKVSTLLLTAPPGCGKTTLVKKLCQDEEIKGKFGKNIFFICVSKTPSLKVIVDKLFEHKDLRVPEFESDEEAIDLLGRLLEDIKGPKLLILDDVWSQSLFKQLEFDIPEYQILVTSRDGFKQDRFTYELRPLDDMFAKQILCHLSGLKEESSIPNEEMKKVLKVCGGYPIALEVIGGSLSGELLEAWHILAEDDHSILDSHTKLLNCLQRSLDFLDGITKECFLDLGLFPEDHRIPVAALIDMWAESHKLDEDGFKAIVNLHKINRQHLANLVLMRKDVSDVGNYYNEDFVFQHDLLRDLAIRESNKGSIGERKRLILDISGNGLPEWWSEKKPQPINAQLMSITTGGFLFLILKHPHTYPHMSCDL